MKSRPEDRPKLIGLLIAIVGVFAYVLITLVPKMTGAQTVPPPSVPPPPAAVAVASPPGNAAASAQSSAGAALPDGDSDAIPPPPAHDSFTPPVGDKKGPFPIPGAPAVKPAVVAKPSAPATVPAVAGSAAGSAQIAPVAPALPPIELKGVILGDPAIAVLSVNNEVVQRQAGDQIAVGLKLTRISETGIVLQEGSKQIPVTVGHSMVASSPQALSAQVPAPSLHGKK